MFWSRRAFLSAIGATVTCASMVGVAAARGGGGSGHDSAIGSGTKQIPCPKKTSATKKTSASKKTAAACK